MGKKKLKKAIKEFFNIDLYDYQLDFVYDCLTQERIVGVFARQSGKSLCISFVAVIEALRNPRENILIISHTDLQAGELFEKVAMNLRGSSLASEIESITKRTVIFKNGARVFAVTCGDTGETIRGLTGKVIILEEAPLIKDSIVYEVITPMGAAKNAKFIKIGTPLGMNHFHKSVFKDHWTVHRISYERVIQAGHFTQSFIDEQKEMLGEFSNEFRTEYGAEFIADEDAYFSTQLIQESIAEYPMMEMNY